MLRIISALAMIVALTWGSAQAQTRVTLKSATAGSSYYVMMVQLGEVLRASTDGRITATIEESQGSVQNVKEAPRRAGNFLFTTPPSLVRDAQAGKAPFAGETGHDAVRTLFVMPPVTMHWIVRGDAGIKDLTDLAGKKFIPGGRGTFTQRQSAAVFRLLGIEGKVEMPDIELNAAVGAMRNRQVDGFASGSTHPTAMVQELAATLPIMLLSMTRAQVEQAIAADPGVAPVTIAANTYQGQTADVTTLGVPVGAYGTTKMDEATAYEITRVFWTKRAEMARQNPWWNAVAPEQLVMIGVKLHPGAARYYAEAGIKVPENMN